MAGQWRKTCHVLADTTKYYSLGGRRVAMRKVPAGQAGTLSTYPLATCAPQLREFLLNQLADSK